MTPTSYKLISAKQIAELTTLSRTTIDRFVVEGVFPKPIQITPRRKAWVLSEVEEWMRGLESRRQA